MPVDENCVSCHNKMDCPGYLKSIFNKSPSTMHWYNSMTRPDLILEDRRGEFRDCYKVYINFDQSPEFIGVYSPEEPVISFPVSAFTPEGDVINFWVKEPVVPRGSWKCESCGGIFRDIQSPGITNSGAGKSQCRKCYNQGIPVDLSADLPNYCQFYKVKCNQSVASNKYGDDCGSLNCPMG